ncbi:MAG: MarR family transcriptional regulator [Acidobacteriota bacterium]
MGASHRSIGSEIKQRRPFASKAQEATVALLRTADLVRRRLSKIVEPSGVTLQQYNVLRILRGSQGQPLSAIEVGERLIEEVPGVSRLLDRLVGKGLVRRERAVADRRMLECAITAKGLDLLARLDAAVDRGDEQIGQRLTARGIETLNDLLGRIRESEG